VLNFSTVSHSHVPARASGNLAIYDTAELEQAAQCLNVLTKPFPLGNFKRVVQNALAP
jgi:hypothetical protein